MSTPPPPRLLALDAIRGVAVMGILLLNIFGFSMPNSGYINPAAYGGTGPVDIAAWGISFIMFEAKFRGLFSLLFGASMTLVIDRARASGQSGAAVHYRRLFWLLLFGLAHHLLIWDGDILVQYALIGAVAFLFVSRSPRVLRAWVVGLLALSILTHVGVVAGAYALKSRAESPTAPAGARATYAGLLDGFSRPGNAGIAKDLVQHRADYPALLETRARDLSSIVGVLVAFGFETLGMMVLGILLYRNGFLGAAWEPARYRRWGLCAYAIGLPPLIALAAWNYASGFDALDTFATFFAIAEPFKYAVVVGHAALGMLLIRRWSGAWLTVRVAAAGRMAFTNYLATSIVMTSLFYGYGGGLYGHVGRAEAYLFVAGMWAAMLAWSKPWLDAYRYGPFEWAWRSLSRGAAQPMRIA